MLRKHQQTTKNNKKLAKKTDKLWTIARVNLLLRECFIVQQFVTFVVLNLEGDQDLKYRLWGGVILDFWFTCFWYVPVNDYLIFKTMYGNMEPGDPEV